ncbi:hypothetical protein MWU59_05060 [Flavobacteriaceae bacterium F08102]|nr:hypothetical protein [Flavobacteriaceae bacterium F08102]
MMIRTSVAVLLLSLLVVTGACRKDFGTILSSGDLAFSVDTLLLNRVFEDISSSTQSFKVYNRSKEAIRIPQISLGRGDQSFYRLNIDGVPGKSFEDVEILGKDSIFVFVEATIDFDFVDPDDFFYRDAVIFDTGMYEQRVPLEALVLDVNLIRPDRTRVGDDFVYETIVLGEDEDGQPLGVRGVMLSGNTTFTNEKPYLIYGYIGVPENSTLTIEAGARLYFHNESGIVVDKKGSLKVLGTADEKVLFEDDRLEPEFEDVAGLWETIWLRAGSKNNIINHAVIKNNTIGILVDSIGNSQPTLQLTNSEIYNSANFGMLGRETHIKGENIVIGSAGQSSLACTMGGIYNFKHATFSNYWSQSFRQFPTVLVTNFFSYIDGSTTVVETRDLVEATFTNCIIAGNQNVEFMVDKVAGADFNFTLNHCMLQFETNQASLLNNPLYDFSDTNFYQQVILNRTTDFMDPAKNRFLIGEASAAVNSADLATAQDVPVDLVGVDRTVNPDIGAYQHIIFEEDK